MKKRHAITETDLSAAAQPLSVLTLAETPEEQSLDFQPKTFEEYLGQAELKKKLALYTQAALMRNEPLDHLLLFGPPGVGKTTLALIMAHVMHVPIKICSGPMLERTGDLVALLSQLEPRSILFIDEIHRMPTAIEEILYSAMEHFRVDIIIGQGAGAQSVNLPLNPFTLIGATTKAGMISAPLRSRFGITERLDFYTDEDLQQIILQSAHHLSVDLSPEGALLVARCSRGTPRIAKKIMRRVRDFAQIYHNNSASMQTVEQALAFLGIDHTTGLSAGDKRILQALVQMYNGGPAGLETIAALTGEDAQTIEDVYEPFLMRKGYLEKTPRGRQIPFKQLPFLKSIINGQQTFFEK